MADKVCAELNCRRFLIDRPRNRHPLFALLQHRWYIGGGRSRQHLFSPCKPASHAVSSQENKRQACIHSARVSAAVFRRENGALFLEQVRRRLLLVRDQTPFSSTAKAQLVFSDWKAYAQAVSGLDAVVAYAIKANNNPAICGFFASLGAGAVVVSGSRNPAGAGIGFSPTKMLLRQRKRRPVIWMRRFGIILISVDSEFDLEQIVARAVVSVTAKLLLRASIRTSIRRCIRISRRGFWIASSGFPKPRSKRFVPDCACLSQVEVVGLHCHLGSTLQDGATAARYRRD